MTAPSTARLRAAALALAGALALPGAALAQDGAAPRPIPDGFVVPGPAPTNAPPAGTMPGMAPGVVPGARPADPRTGAPMPSPAAPAAPSATPAAQAGVTSQGGRMAPSQSTVVGPAGASAANPMAFARPGAKGTTNWPCVQRKVEDISIGQVWNGPDPASASSVERTAPMRALVGELAARRLPLPEAQARAEAFLKTVPEAERAKTATAVFADLFAILNTERTEIMQGIERYGAKQKAMAETIRAENAKLSKLRAAADAAPADIDQAMQTVTWDTRIFNERRQSLTFVCEVPTIIEQRLFGLGRTLSAGL